MLIIPDLKIDEELKLFVIELVSWHGRKLHCHYIKCCTFLPIILNIAQSMIARYIRH